jgi:hypothetical protein
MPIIQCHYNLSFCDIAFSRIDFSFHLSPAHRLILLLDCPFALSKICDEHIERVQAKASSVRLVSRAASGSGPHYRQPFRTDVWSPYPIVIVISGLWHFLIIEFNQLVSIEAIIIIIVICRTRLFIIIGIEGLPTTERYDKWRRRR